MESRIGGCVHAPQSATTGRTLIVEDEPLIGMSLKDLLERSGGAPVWVETDQAAYAALDTVDFDTLILDIDLGAGTTGFDVARYARRLHPQIAIVFSSGTPADWLGQFGVEGAVFVSKPCTEAGILAALGRAADQMVVSSST